jgi:hypothetical protein
VCEIAGVAPIPVSTAREWLPEAFVAVVLTKGVDVQRVVHLGRRFRAVQRTALQWTDPVCARRGCSNRLRLQYDHFEDWAHTRTTRVWSGKRFCDPCHRLKSSGWIVSSPDADGKCDFRPPPGDAAAALAEAVDHAVTVRRARAAGREPPALAPG